MSKIKKSIFLALALVLALSAALFGYGAYSVSAFQKTDKIIENTYFYDIDIGGKTIEEAEKLIISNETLPIYIPITVEYEGKTFSFSPNGAGISHNLEAITEKAYKAGREESFFKNLGTLMDSGKVKKLGAEYKENRDSFETTVETLMHHENIFFEDFKVDVKASYAEIEIGKERIQADFDKLIKDTYEVIEKPAEERKLKLSVKPREKLDADKIYEKIYVEPKDAVATQTDGKTTVKPHQVEILLDKSEIEAGLESGKDKFRIKIKKQYPEITTEHLNGMLFGSTLGICKSNFNQNLVGRSKNVALSASKINGLILNPGEVFSYNEAVGPRTLAAGFENATVYTNTGLEEGVGGGICQVSSTLYNAVLYADLKIEERRNHMYTVGYVRNGLDATVSYGEIDFKFSNNKSGPIKISAWTQNGVLTVSISGKKETNNKIELYTNTLETYEYETKEVVNEALKPGERNVKQSGAKGYKITAAKVVKGPSGKVIRNEYLGTSVYKPITEIIEVGAEDTSVSAKPDSSEENQPSSEAEKGQAEEKTEADIEDFAEEKEENKEEISKELLEPEKTEESLKTDIVKDNI